MSQLNTPYDKSCALVLGAGISGVAAAQLLRARGGRVLVLDEAQPEKLTDAASALIACGAELRAGGGALPDVAFDVCVVSPGIPMEHAWLDDCRARRIPVIAETELGFAYWPGRVLAVTGSKGKTSLVKLCADTLNLAGVTAAPAGNYGVPLSRLALRHPELSWAVVEVSSFQIEHLDAFHPNVAVLLNVQPDHLDRHPSLAVYRNLKLRLFARQGADDVALLPQGLRVGKTIPQGLAPQRFGAGASCAWRYREHAVTGRVSNRILRISLAGSYFDNPILGLAAAAGAGALSACGLSEEAITRGFAAFEPLPHRMQKIAEYQGVHYVDDSKATSLSAVKAALQMIPGPVRLIAGGRLKEHDLNCVKELLTHRAKKVYVIGECAGRMLAAWSDAVPCENCRTLDQAVTLAASEAHMGDTVLLSPGCASFDQFGSYRERGEQFTRLVRAIVSP